MTVDLHNLIHMRTMYFYHEQVHRTAEVMKRLHDLDVTICGAGAVGANLAESLARSGIGRLTVIDRDRVEARNLSTQPFEQAEVGAQKATMVANRLYRAVGTGVQAVAKELTAANVHRMLTGSALIVDAFDNSAARQAVHDACAKAQTPCLHVGMAATYAEVIWDECYRVPSAANDDVCDYPLARTLVTLAVSVACEVLIRFAVTGARESYTITQEDFAIRPFI